MDTKEKHRLRNPGETSNFLSSLFFGWLVPIFHEGAKRDLEIKDLYDPLRSDESERLGDRLEREWKKELAMKTRKKNLLWALTRMFWFPFMVQGVLLLVLSVVLKVAQPLLQGCIIGYFNPVSDGNEESITKDQVLINAGLLVFVTVLSTLIYHHHTLRCQRIGMCMRVACCSLIYRKILRLDHTSLNQTTAGRVANLLSNDVARFDHAIPYLHYIWITPIQVVFIAHLMWRSVGIAALFGIGAMVMQSIPIQAYTSNIAAKVRSKIAAKTDERVQLMSELISGIQVVKMYSWENPFEKIVSQVRKIEMKWISITTSVRAFYSSVLVFSERVNLYSTLIAFVLLGNPLTGEVAFVLATLFNILQNTCTGFLPYSFLLASETSVSLRRLTEFLLLDEVKCTGTDAPAAFEDRVEAAEKTETDTKIVYGVEIEMVKVAANWVHGHLPPTLCEVSMKVKSRSLCAIVGPVGSGKSSLIHVLLGELPVGAGKLWLYTGEDSQTKITSRDIRISYTSQDAWLFSVSIRDNILFGQPYDEGRYKEVTRVCALWEDFEQLPQGDLTFVGERGASLSGGQRARVNLARAVYRDAELYLLDDPLSAVDARVGRHLFEECIAGFLKDKTRILVTHQLQYLQHADSIVVLNHGTVEHQGTYEELAKSNIQIRNSGDSEGNDEVDYVAENREGDVEQKNTVTVTEKGNNQSSVVSGNGEVSSDKNTEEVVTGNMSNDVYWGYFLAGGNVCSLATILVAYIVGQISANGTDYWLLYWTNQEALRVASQLKNVTADNAAYQNENKSDHWATESQWFDEYGLIRSYPAIYVYTGCVIACMVFVALRNMMFIRICMNASRNIHNSMFSNLLRATMRFFNTNPSGRILNRFSKDVGTMDEQLPIMLLQAIQVFATMIGILTTITIINNWILIPIVVMAGIFYLSRAYFLKTAQNLKRLEGIAKSPVFSDVSSTLDGLTTIRSRGLPIEILLRKEFDRHQDTHTGAWYLTIASASAFGFILDFITCCFTACVYFSFILTDDGNTLGGSVGLAISQSLILTGMVQYGIRQSTEVISQMTSVERVLQYTNLPKERALTSDDPPPPTWPSKGGLIFNNVSMRYADDKQLVLKGLNLNIKPGWKVGIVGRTGAGKSSLISALFALTGEGLEGEISLDGIDTKSIGLHELRPRISIIPQEPILFSASLRYNLDPFAQYSDAELWDSLREVELGDAVPSLDFRVAGGGANFSVGQRQLICLARAILRNNRVLVLDEATANIDSHTDALIQKTIRRRFANCTVLTIAHRLNTIMDSDRVLMMVSGHAVEFGHPHLLLKNRDGPFSQMLQQTGNAMAEKLAAIAETAFLLRSQSVEVSKNGTSTSTGDQITHL